MKRVTNHNNFSFIPFIFIIIRSDHSQLVQQKKAIIRRNKFIYNRHFPFAIANIIIIIIKRKKVVFMTISISPSNITSSSKTNQ
jgi:hypothetical protein